MTAATVGPPLPPASPAGGPAAPDAAHRAVEEFEAVFLAQVLSGLFQGLSGGALGVDGPEGEAFAGLLREEYAKLISRSGGIGLGDDIRREMLRLQEATP